MASAPTEPSAKTARKLFALSRNHCAFPGCPGHVVDPSTQTITAEICHIEAQRPGGPRYNVNQSAEARHSAQNLILLCSVHHKIIDAPENLSQFTTERLLAMKEAHERQAVTVALPPLSDALLLQLLATAKGAAPTANIDFRGATLKAGGDGGHFGGGGGAGGVINIIGVTPAGFHEPIDATGGDGRAPGAGGGGGGVVTFSGRKGDESDIENGLRLSSLFLADAVDLSTRNLFSVVGGGWSWIYLTKPFSDFNLCVQCVFETGDVVPETILRIECEVRAPSGLKAAEENFDLVITQGAELIKRCLKTVRITFVPNVVGKWTLWIGTGGITLGTYDFEVRDTAREV